MGHTEVIERNTSASMERDTRREGRMEKKKRGAVWSNDFSGQTKTEEDGRHCSNPYQGLSLALVSKM